MASVCQHHQAQKDTKTQYLATVVHYIAHISTKKLIPLKINNASNI